jgi:hypothetical protein
MLRKKRSHPSGAIVWSGQSRIDGQPIVLLVTGLFTPSSNPKTGPMHQTWIFRQGVHPFEAIKSGEDISVCGYCPLRFNPDTGKRICYVMAAPLGRIYKAYLAGRYKPVQLDSHGDIWFDLGRLRIGAYGDPAAVPIEVWIDWLDLLKALKIGWTGYTRRWMYPENQGFKQFLMASTFSDAEQAQAKSLGWHTYRVLQKGAELPESATVCPGSEEGGYAKQCRECLMCKGTTAGKDIVTYAHGGHGKYFIAN